MRVSFPPVGQDDGFWNNKLILPNGEGIIVPSRGRFGPANAMAMAGINNTICEYSTNEKVYSAGSVESDSTENDEYPYSDLNRIIVHHALHSAGMSGQTINICTGLPINRYYHGYPAEKNEELIKKKEDSLRLEVNHTKGDPLGAGKEEARSRIKFHKVETIPEGMAAWFDYLIKEEFQKSGKVDFQLSVERQSEPLAFIDFGGRTTDVAVIIDGVVDMIASGSMNKGLLDVRKMVKAKLQQRFGLNQIRDRVLDKVLTDNVIELSGKPNKVSDIVSSSKREISEGILAEVKARLGKARDLKKVLYIGGGVLQLENEISSWFEHQETVNEPIFANARGMSKYMKYVA